MAEVMFYERVVALNRDAHRGLRLRGQLDGFRFSSGAISIPLVGVEFGPASRDYPILFTAGTGENLPVVMVGLRPGENLYVDGAGRWEESAYIPAFIRRYPFVFAKAPAEDRLTVCIDEASAKWSREEGVPLFEEDGGEAPQLKQTIAFLQDYQGQVERTRAMVQRLETLDLLKQRDLQAVLQDGTRFLLRDFRVVDEDRLLALPDEAVLAMHRSGELGWIHAHILSVANTSRLLERLRSLRVGIAA